MLRLIQGPFDGWDAGPGLPGKPHLFFKLQLLELAQRDAEFVSLSTKVGPVGRDLRGFFFFRLLNVVILHEASSYAPGPKSRESAASAESSGIANKAACAARNLLPGT
jgi:hypothetical protein